MQIWPQSAFISATETRLPVSANKGFCIFTGYGFVDFDSPAAAQKAVASLKANGVQAQMAKVRLLRFACVRARVYVCINISPLLWAVSEVEFLYTY
jgi:uncharacterized protein YegP (UPF0339 family)